MNTEIISIISKEANIAIEKITLESTLLGDLKLDGDDAWEVFEQCQKKFNVDFKMFNFNKHFRNEPCFKGFTYLFRLIKYKDEHMASGKAPITVAQLISACRIGYWPQSID